MYLILLFFIFTFTSCLETQQEPKPFGLPESGFTFLEDFSDEFNNPQIDLAKWEVDVAHWGPWSWSKENVFQQDGNLHIRMTYEPHHSRGMDMFYKSGIIRSRKAITYGYFEAKIKSCDRYPGVCPAFWMKGTVGNLSSEVDFVELQQSPEPGQLNRVDFCYHARVLIDGKPDWVRGCHNWYAPWDPRDDFHIYGCMVTEDSIKWFVDGELRAEMKNDHWHLPSYVMLSMGTRRPLHINIRDDSGVRIDRLPNPEESVPEGFPTDMIVEYVRVWSNAKTN